MRGDTLLADILFQNWLGPSFTKEGLHMHSCHAEMWPHRWKGLSLEGPDLGDSCRNTQGWGAAVVDTGLMPSSHCAKVLSVNIQFLLT